LKHNPEDLPDFVTELSARSGQKEQGRDCLRKDVPLTVLVEEISAAFKSFLNQRHGRKFSRCRNSICDGFLSLRERFKALSFE